MLAPKQKVFCVEIELDEVAGSRDPGFGHVFSVQSFNEYDEFLFDYTELFTNRRFTSRNITALSGVRVSD